MSAEEKQVTAAVLLIGNELLSGRTQDLNLQFIAQHLTKHGVQVALAQVIPDDVEVIVNTVNWTRTRYDYVFTTGGIGPTHDDITTECIAKAFGVPLVVDERIAAKIRSHNTTENVMTNRLRMARVPKGADLIDNLTGGPQGFYIGNVYVMAGIPRILQAMLPTVKLSGGIKVQSCSMDVYLGESHVANDLDTIQRANPLVEIGSYPFKHGDIYGTSVVMRSADENALRMTFDTVYAAVCAKGTEPRKLKGPWIGDLTV